MEVNRASQAHQVPHVGLPHIAPVEIANKVNINPSGAIDLDKINSVLILKTKTKSETKTITEKIISDSQADGTWTYKILTLSP